MDYTSQNLVFKVKKLLRYCFLYGLRRTLVKVRGQYHMKRQYSKLPPILEKSKATGTVGLIGCGNFQFSNVAYYLNKNYGRCIRGAMDVDINRAVSLSQHYHLDYYTDDAQRLISDSSINLIYIASNHASHAEYAIDAILAGKDVHIEKPHCVTEDQLHRLLAAMEEGEGRVLSVGYNRPMSDIGQCIKKNLESQSGQTMLNWFVAGHELDKEHWYFQDAEGGRILGNLCHWTDFSYQMIDEAGRYPLKIIPTRSEKSDCDIAVNFLFGDGSIAAITFSAKGHTFEGVREKLAAHRGDVLIGMDDFKDLNIEIVDKKTKLRQWFRDHGHERSICSSYEASQNRESMGLSRMYVWESAQLFLATREALESNSEVVVNGFDDFCR